MVDIKKPIQSASLLIDGYQALNRSLHQVLEATVPLVSLEVSHKKKLVRLEESSFDIADKTERLTPVVTAHDLNQYVNRFYSINLTEADSCWLDILLDFDPEDIDLSGFGGTE